MIWRPRLSCCEKTPYFGFYISPMLDPSTIHRLDCCVPRHSTGFASFNFTLSHDCEHDFETMGLFLVVFDTAMDCLRFGKTNSISHKPSYILQCCSDFQLFAVPHLSLMVTIYSDDFEYQCQPSI